MVPLGYMVWDRVYWAGPILVAFGGPVRVLGGVGRFMVEFVRVVGRIGSRALRRSWLVLFLG